MNQKWKRMLALLLAALMILGLCACGSKGESKDSGSDAQESAADSESGEQEESSAVQAEGELATLKMLGANKSGVDDNGVSYYLADWASGKTPSYLWDTFCADLAEYGVKLELELVEEGQEGVIYQTKIASGQLLDYDLIQNTADTTGTGGNVIDDKTFRNLIANGTLVPTDEIIENYCNEDTLALYNGDFAEGYNGVRFEDGHCYTLATVAYSEYGDTGLSPASANTLMIRQDWLDQLNLAMPTTADELYDVLMQFREQDANGDGEANEVADLGKIEEIPRGIALSFEVDDSIRYDRNTKKVEAPWTCEMIQDYFRYMQKLYEAKIYDPNATETFQNNRSSVIQSWWEIPNEGSVIVPEGTQAPQYVGFFVSAEEGRKPWSPVTLHYRDVPSEPNGKTLVTSSADKEAVAHLIDYINTDRYFDMTEYGLEGYNFDMVDGRRIKKVSDDPDIQLINSLPALWQGLFPRRQIDDYEDTIFNAIEAGKSMGYPEEGFKEKGDAYRRIFDHPEDLIEAPQVLLDAYTEEESARYNELIGDYTTYWQEMHANLIMGTQPLEDWDSYIEDLNSLGMQELIDIEQARVERGMEKFGYTLE